MFGKGDFVCGSFGADTECWGPSQAEADLRHLTVRPPAGFRVTDVSDYSFVAIRGAEIQLGILIDDPSLREFMDRGLVRLPPGAGRARGVQLSRDGGLVAAEHGVFGFAMRSDSAERLATRVNVGVALDDATPVCATLLVGGGRAFRFHPDPANETNSFATDDPTSWTELTLENAAPIATGGCDAGMACVVSGDGAARCFDRDGPMRPIRGLPALAPLGMDVSHGRGCVLLSDHSLWCFETRVAVASVEATAVDAFVYGTDELCFTQGTNIVCKPREGVHRTLPR